MLERRIPLAEAVAAARSRHAQTIDAFGVWATTVGRTVDPDVAALIHAVEEERRPDEGWDREGFYSFYRCRLWNWCTLADCGYPHDELPETLWLWLHHRDLTGRWGPDDEPLHDLLKVLLCYGNVGFDGRRLPGEKARRLVPCECFVSRPDVHLPSGEPPTVEDLDQELADELGYVPRPHE